MLTSRVLQDARTFFENRGTLGLEGTAMINKGKGLELVIPRQNARRDAFGSVNVEVPRAGQMDLALALGPDELYVARIHSHPGNAFHSPADDANPVITFEGGISIVVPYFGLGLRRGLDACAVYRFCDGSWDELMAGPDRDRWIVAEESS
ncbi:Mov34/MPN/PAD-1 family protein [Phycicoccus sp. DTK01]|uniref:Mov34/MPN/PAD-1 family protein n=1 Tax=Phycicoccus sp. DTK01 TaxID=2785745 RepID=UPI001A8ED578|nr:Mov34/MPN/PAD-1 family protein [Phycicoccus sp. DTK01]GIL37013.1 hypothetical protein PDTK01_30880 [Phycicoccus sp. DTK01]